MWLNVDCDSVTWQLEVILRLLLGWIACIKSSLMPISETRVTTVKEQVFPSALGKVSVLFLTSPVQPV